MGWVIALSPAGHLLLREDPAEHFPAPEKALRQLETALHRSTADGLLCLGGPLLSEPLPASMTYWREFAASCLTQRCRQPAPAATPPPSLPSPGWTAWGERILSAPPLPGGEYLSPDLLERLWGELDALIQQRMAASTGGAEDFFRQLHPRWHLVGRVTFHLAENKRDPARPFAFLATYTHRLNNQSQPQYLPLAQALKEYSGLNSRPELDRLLEPIQRAAQNCVWARELIESRAVFAPQAWTAAQAYAFLRAIPELEPAGVAVRLPDWWKGRPAQASLRVTLGPAQKGLLGAEGLLAFHVTLAAGEEELTEDELRSLRSSGPGLVLLRGKWVEVDGDRLRQALAHWEGLRAQNPNGVSWIDGMRLLAGAGGEKGPWAHAAETAGMVQLRTTPELEAVLTQLRQPEAIPPFDAVTGLQARLRPYQEIGARWVWFLARLGLGACLADDMGLGKTIQVIAALLHQRQARPPGSVARPSLLIAPASLLANWESEVAKFAPSLKFGVLHPSWAARQPLWQAWQTAPGPATAVWDLVATTYGLAARTPDLREIEWDWIILDEAQAIKNPGAKQTQAVKQLKGRARLVLTGTPVENRLDDLWSICDFFQPGLLGPHDSFRKFVKGAQEQGTAGLAPVRRLISPHLLRRLKTDRRVIADLPDKTIVKAHCGLAARQAALYGRLVEDLRRDLAAADGIQRKGLVLAALMRFKQACNHPSQLLGDGLYAPEDSGKWRRLRDLAEEIGARQEKMLVFTQFKELTEPLAAHLAAIFQRSGCVLHGGTPLPRRRELVAAFQHEDGPPFFVLSVKAGGTGLNLTEASHVVHFDRWWNPAVENQATDRAFRIGQKRAVLVHLFITRGTVEEKIDALLESKRGLAESVLGGEGEIPLTEMSNEEILRLVALDASALHLE